MQLLCGFEAGGDGFEAQVGEFLNDSVHRVESGLDATLPLETLSFARTLALGTWKCRENLDARLDRNAPQWTVSRMPPVDRNILRIAVFELLEQPDTPARVVINEALEIAKRFGDVDSSRFVNGVLDQVLREIRTEAGSVETG